MPTQINANLQMDPATKLEVWLFQRIATSGGPHGKPVYRRLPYNLVQFDGSPDMYIEPIPASGSHQRLLDGTGDPISPFTEGTGRMVGAQFFDARPFETFGINEVDYAGNVGQLA